jgi:hypothetical protein
VDHFNHEAIAADGTTVGIARYLRTGNRGAASLPLRRPTTGGSAIDRILLERIATRARSVGIEPFTVMCLATNNTDIHLLSRLGRRQSRRPTPGCWTSASI